MLYSSIHEFEPLYPENTAELEDLSRAVVAASASLEGGLPTSVLNGIRGLLRITNSYYSNLIEGHNTRPIDVERAMKSDFSDDAAKRDLQTESLVHIEVQQMLESRVRQESGLDVTSEDFLRWIHREFYGRLPESLRWITDDNNNAEFVAAGEFRSRMVIVGQHLPPTSESLPAFAARFNEFYRVARFRGLKPLIAIAAAHHRLMWIHPFLDGNGRVARLFTDAYFMKLGTPGYGLWNVSRGLARRRDDYRRYLAAADFPRESDLDGRGALSEQRLVDFCRFFLKVCLDQATYMAEMLRLDTLIERIDGYLQLRNKGMLIGSNGRLQTPIDPRSMSILSTLLLHGEVSRGSALAAVGTSERTARRILKSLIEEGLVVSSSEKGNVRLGFPVSAAGYWFPDLMPID